MIVLLPVTLATVIYERRSLIKGVIIWNAFLFLQNEVLSLFHMLGTGGVAVTWILFEIFFAALIIRKKDFYKPDVRFTPLFLLPAALFLALLFLAVFTVPYNHDSMCYHLPRIMFWLQNRSVDYFAANDMRQLVTSPFTEYVQLQTMILGGDDTYFNLVSFCAGVISAYLIYSLVLKITSSAAASVLASVIFVSTPVIESEIISTQVDVMASMWVIICVSLIRELAYDETLKPDLAGISRTAMLGTAMGLLFISKTNACIPVAVMLIWLLFERIRLNDRITALCVYIAAAAAAAVVFAIPSFVRNFNLSGDIIASDYMGNIAVGSFLPSYLIVNALKNAVLVGVLSGIPDNPLRSAQIFLVKGAGKVLGVDINDPVISFVTGETAFQDNTGLSYEHDHAGAQFLMILFIVLALVYLSLSLKKKKTDLFMIFLMIQAPVMFCVVRWQPWGGRLLMPSLVLMIIFTGGVLGNIFKENKNAVYILGGAVLLISGFVFIRSYQYNLRPAILNISGKYSKNQLYFYNNGFESDLADNYEEICLKALQTEGIEKDGCGLSAGGFIYPELRILMSKNVRVENINPSWEAEGFYPACIVSAGGGMAEGDTMIYNGYEYQCTETIGNGRFALLKKCEQIN